MEGQQMPPQSAPPQTQMNEDPDVRDNKIWALLAYFGILVLIPLLAKKDSKFAQFHAKQGLVMLIAWFFSWIPILGWLLGLALLVLWVMAVINVLQGKYWKMPVLGDFAEKINI